MKKTATEYYRQRRGNCAQSVAFAWNALNPERKMPVELFSGCGGGRAPEGLCGALYAGCVLAGPSAAEAIRQAFAERSGGHVKCREIRQARKLVCHECVALAAELLERHSRNESTSEVSQRN